MKDYILLMHDDGRQGAETDAQWEAYFDALHARGAFQGGAVIAMVVALVSGLVLFGLTRVGVEPLLPAVPTWLLCTALGALLGALAGGLAFSSQSNAPLQRLHAQLHRHRSILLVEGPLASIHDLHRFAPMRVGVLA